MASLTLCLVGGFEEGIGKGKEKRICRKHWSEKLGGSSRGLFNGSNLEKSSNCCSKKDLCLKKAREVNFLQWIHNSKDAYPSSSNAPYLNPFAIPLFTNLSGKLRKIKRALETIGWKC
ncbi:hypothetical protein HYC85_024014 [Camellia sinensis]|uniref:Uncharacterized protein n=1 Tax=Camellia sinensis TaxID=4442 RepID=A0A7J7GHH9_CAMSI|nr:hypothetical protein HYC85_024014 [Camellia sinensis]